MNWDTNQYLKFAEERKQPCLDLLARLEGPFASVLDLGCGPGNSTGNIAAKFPSAQVMGLDPDENMLERARKEHPHLRFVQGSAPADLPGLGQTFDLVFSNACIHWIKEQEELIRGVHAILHENGVFAVQLPLTEQAPFHQLVRRLAEEKWPQLRGVQSFHNLTAEGYYNALSGLFGDVTLWQTNYYHVMEKEMVIEWYKGSGLKPYLSALAEGERTVFLQELQNTIHEEYPRLRDGKVALLMPRLFFVAQK